MNSKLTLKDFKPGDRVIYVPDHLDIGDALSSSCEVGVVTTVNNLFVFVRYFSLASGELKETSMGTKPKNLLKMKPLKINDKIVCINNLPTYIDHSIDEVSKILKIGKTYTVSDQRIVSNSIKTEPPREQVIIDVDAQFRMMWFWASRFVLLSDFRKYKLFKIYGKG